MSEANEAGIFGDRRTWEKDATPDYRCVLGHREINTQRLRGVVSHLRTSFLGSKKSLRNTPTGTGDVSSSVN